MSERGREAMGKCKGDLEMDWGVLTERAMYGRVRMGCDGRVGCARMKGEGRYRAETVCPITD